MEKILAIYGAGGLGREVKELAKVINNHLQQWHNIVFVDDLSFDNNSIFSFDYLLNEFSAEQVEFVIAVGEPKIRKKLAEKVEKESKFNFSTLIHPSVIIPDDTKILKGSIICANCFISCNVHIGEHVYFQPMATIGHDSTVSEYSVISTNVAIAGNCKIGSETYIGLNVPIKEKVNIGNKVIVGMGSVVFKDIPDKTIAMGNPARPIRNNIDEKVFK